MKKYLQWNRACLAGALVCVLISNLLAVVLQFIKGDVLDSAILGEMSSTLISALMLIGLILLEILLYFGYNRFSARFTVGCAKHLKHDVFDSIMRRGYVNFKEQTQGEYIAKYTSEADAIMSRRFSMLPLFWNILFKIIFVSIALFFLDWRIALITILLLTTPLYIPKLIEKRLQRAQSDHLKAVEENLSKISDWLAGFEIIKNFSIERKIMERFKSVNDYSMEMLLRDKQLGAVAQLITTLISYLSYFIVLAVAAWLVLSGDFSAGDFFVAIGMIDQLSYPLISLAEIIRQLVAIKPVCISMEQFIGNHSDSPQSAQRLTTVNRDIRYRSVCFSYNRQAPVLNGFDFSIEKGKRYLIKGPSGCGKTTAANLLLRYYDVDTGFIEIDGIPITNYSSTYDCMTVVRQEAILFNDSLRNNLTMFSEIPDKKMIEVLETLGLNKFASVESLDSIISANGSNLSGGERKRICLARAFLRDTDVLILDEPLANLDDETAGKIEDLLISIKGKTLLIVSHQFSEEKLGAFSEVRHLSLSD